MSAARSSWATLHSCAPAIWASVSSIPEPTLATSTRLAGTVSTSGGGGRGRLEAESLARENPNVYLEFCGSFTTPRPFETSLQLVCRERVLFGSDTAAHDAAWELGRYLSMPLPDNELIPGLGTNMQGILALKERND